MASWIKEWLGVEVADRRKEGRYTSFEKLHLNLCIVNGVVRKTSHASWYPHMKAAIHFPFTQVVRQADLRIEEQVVQLCERRKSIEPIHPGRECCCVLGQVRRDERFSSRTTWDAISHIRCLGRKLILYPSRSHCIRLETRFECQQCVPESQCGFF
jgi:hypothetical protein